MSHRFDSSILREYDIRGVWGTTLGEADAYAIGRSFATVVRRAEQQPSGGNGAVGGNKVPASKVVVGRDGRLSSPMLEAALVRGLSAGGVDVVQIGLGPTPMLYFAEASEQQVQGGIQITGSHNPADHNGFKLVLHGGPFFGEDIDLLGALALAGDWSAGKGTIERRELLGAYVERLRAALDGIDPAQLARLRIGWDAGNGAAGPALELLTKDLPGEHHLLFTHVDGTFPNHHPDPTDDANLTDLAALVAAKRLDFGVAFDGDGDRIVVIDEAGVALRGDALLMIFAEDVLTHNPGAAVIADVKVSASLFARVLALGGVPIMWKSGHSQIKSKMKQTGALLGGELSGHVFFADEYYGFDDALYAALRLIAVMARQDRPLSAMRAALPKMVNTPELRFRVIGQRKFAVIEEVRIRLEAAGADLVVLDGVRVNTPDGWWLLRASNTEDIMVARAESESAVGLARLLAQIDGQLALSGILRAP